MTTVVLSKLTDLLPTSGFDLSPFQATLLEIYASLLPAIPIPLLQTYLDRLEHHVLSLTAPRSERRRLVLLNIFKGISEGLGDEGKELGVAWWMDVKRKVEGEERRGMAGGTSAKL